MRLSELRNMMRAWPKDLDPMDREKQNEYLKSIGMDLAGIYQELEMDSRFVDTHQDISYGPEVVNLHSHSFYELLHCRGTGGVEYLVGAERYKLQKGDVIMVPPGVSHRPLFPEEMTEPYVRDVVWISAEFVQQLRRWFPELEEHREMYSALLHTSEDIRESIAMLFEMGIREAQKEAEDRDMALMANTMALLVQLRRARAKDEARPVKAEKPGRLDQVLQYVEDNLAGKITLEDVAHHFFVSESTIIQLFRKKMGVSFYHCVTQRRLIAAKTMIAQGFSMENVSERVGFSDYSTFYRAFKKEYGISPGQYRKLLQNF